MDNSITVFILAYGEYSGLARTLRSVLLQKCKIAEIMISDDGSGVSIPSYIEKDFPQVKIRQGAVNLGTVAHMNYLAKLATTDFIKFIAAGDAFLDEGSLAALVGFGAEKKSLVVSSKAMVSNEDLSRELYPFPRSQANRLFSKPPQAVFESLCVKNNVSAVGTLFSRKFFTDFGGLNEGYRLLEDWPTWLRLAREGETIPFLDQVTCLYAVGGVSSASGDAFCGEKLKDDMLLCYEREIFPYMENFSSASKEQIAYGYARLQGFSHEELLEKFEGLERKRQWKQRIKAMLMK